ncbi:hypothetical protein ACFL2C_04085 [Patescibacteria group bacterium]
MRTNTVHIQKREFSSKNMLYMFVIPLIFFALVILGYFLTTEFQDQSALGISTSSSPEGGEVFE